MFFKAVTNCLNPEFQSQTETSMCVLIKISKNSILSFARTIDGTHTNFGNWVWISTDSVLSALVSF